MFLVKMALEKKGLQLIRKYDVERAVVKLADDLSCLTCLTGGLASVLFMSDMVSNHINGGWSWQPSWTPGYEINHNGQKELAEVGILFGYIGATVLGTWAVRGVAKPLAKAWKKWRHESSGEQQRDIEFYANYNTLAEKVHSKGFSGVPAALNPDYQDALHLDLLISHLSEDSAAGVRAAELVDFKRKNLAARVIKEGAKKLSDKTLEAYLPFLAPQDFVDLACDYIKTGELDRAEAFVESHVGEEQFRNSAGILSHTGRDFLSLRDKLAEAYFAEGRIADAERVWLKVEGRDKLSRLSGAYRNAGDKENAARAFAKYSQR